MDSTKGLVMKPSNGLGDGAVHGLGDGVGQGLGNGLGDGSAKLGTVPMVFDCLCVRGSNLEIRGRELLNR